MGNSFFGKFKRNDRDDDGDERKDSGKSRLHFIGAIAVSALILAIYFTQFAQEPSAVPDERTAEPPVKATADSLEERLMEVLSKVEGAGSVYVVINYASEGETVAATSTETQNSGDGTRESVTPFTLEDGSGGTEPLVLEKYTPEVIGVVVICEGADDIGVKMDMLSAVTTLLGVSPDQVEVLKGAGAE